MVEYDINAHFLYFLQHGTCDYIVGVIDKKSPKKRKRHAKRANVERAMRIELTTKAWEAFVLPLNYARTQFDFDCIIH